nr:hypothetical protein [Chloroflexia bacterium]
MNRHVHLPTNMRVDAPGTDSYDGNADPAHRGELSMSRPRTQERRYKVRLDSGPDANPDLIAVNLDAVGLDREHGGITQWLAAADVERAAMKR